MGYPMWNKGKTGILVDRGNGVLALVEGGLEFEALRHTAPDWHQEEPSKAIHDRSKMVCTPAQMRLALHRMDLLTQVQAIADADPEASIAWEYATKISRQNPLIDALGGPEGFTPEEIDDIFLAAMQVQT